MLSISYGLLFRDMGSEVNLPVSHGLFSQIGIMCWSIGVGALALALLTRWRTAASKSAFIGYSLLLTVVLAADDAFRIHETFFSETLGLGEGSAFQVYALLLLGYFLLFFRRILTTFFPLLGIALAGFALSVCLD